jgi:hypothetical protein
MTTYVNSLSYCSLQVTRLVMTQRVRTCALVQRAGFAVNGERVGLHGKLTGQDGVALDVDDILVPPLACRQPRPETKGGVKISLYVHADKIWICQNGEMRHSTEPVGGYRVR